MLWEEGGTVEQIDKAATAFGVLDWASMAGQGASEVLKPSK